MPKIIPNNSFKSSLLKTMVADSTNRNDEITFAIMQGSLPSKEDLLGCVDSYHAHGWPYFNASFRTNMEALGSGNTVLLTGSYINFLYQEHLEPEKVRMYFSKRSERFNPDVAGTAGWFFIQYGAAQTMFQNNPSYWAVAGSIGAVGSGADMELSNVELDPSIPFKLSDITLNFSINGRIA